MFPWTKLLILEGVGVLVAFAYNWLQDERDKIPVPAVFLIGAFLAFFIREVHSCRYRSPRFRAGKFDHRHSRASNRYYSGDSGFGLDGTLAQDAESKTIRMDRSWLRYDLRIQRSGRNVDRRIAFRELGGARRTGLCCRAWIQQYRRGQKDRGRQSLISIMARAMARRRRQTLSLQRAEMMPQDCTCASTARARRIAFLQRYESFRRTLRSGFRWSAG